MGVGSIRTRDESGARYTRTWLLFSSGMDNRTWISKGGGGGDTDMERYFSRDSLLNKSESGVSRLNWPGTMNKSGRVTR